MKTLRLPSVLLAFLFGAAGHIARAQQVEDTKIVISNPFTRTIVVELSDAGSDWRPQRIRGGQTATLPYSKFIRIVTKKAGVDLPVYQDDLVRGGKYGIVKDATGRFVLRTLIP